MLGAPGVEVAHDSLVFAILREEACEKTGLLGELSLCLS
jgi:hypothetical protein